MVIGAVGRLEPQKRFDLLLDAFARLRGGRPALRLLIAGDGSLRALSDGDRRSTSDSHLRAVFWGSGADVRGPAPRVRPVRPVVGLRGHAERGARGDGARDAGGSHRRRRHCGGPRDGVDGLIVPTGDASVLGRAIERALDDPDRDASARVHAARRRVETDLSFEARTRRVESDLRRPPGHQTAREGRRRPMRETIKAIARGAGPGRRLAGAAVVRTSRAACWAGDRALEGSTQALALMPGLLGQYLRRAFLARTLADCDRTATIEFGTIFSQAGTRIGLAHTSARDVTSVLRDIGADVLLAAGVHVPSGGATHGIDDPDMPIREQPGTRDLVRIGEAPGSAARRSSWPTSAAERSLAPAPSSRSRCPTM